MSDKVLINEENQEQETTELNLGDETFEDEFKVPTLADYDDEEELYPDGPTVGQAKLWKEQYGRIAAITMDNGDRYMIRPISRLEYTRYALSLEKTSSASGNASQTQVSLSTEESIASIGLLYPQMSEIELKTSAPGGLATLLSQQIMQISSFVAVEAVELQ